MGAEPAAFWSTERIFFRVGVPLVTSSRSFRGFCHGLSSSVPPEPRLLTPHFLWALPTVSPRSNPTRCPRFEPNNWPPPIGALRLRWYRARAVAECLWSLEEPGIGTLPHSRGEPSILATSDKRLQVKT